MQVSSHIFSRSRQTTGNYRNFLSAYFSNVHLAEQRATIHDLLHYAQIPEVYSQRSPGTLLYELELLADLMEFAHYVCNTQPPSHTPDEDREQAAAFLFDTTYIDIRNWEDFPRFIEQQEYVRPVLALTAFFKFQPLEKWIEDLRTLFDRAFCDTAYEGACNLLGMYIHLNKLVEAAYLMHKRDIHIQNVLKLLHSHSSP